MKYILTIGSKDLSLGANYDGAIEGPEGLDVDKIWNNYKEYQEMYSCSFTDFLLRNYPEYKALDCQEVELVS